MKHVFYFFALLVLIAVSAPPMQQVAQAAGDTLDVAVAPAGNINIVINSDTLAGGLRAHPDRVYRLRRGWIYQVTEPIKVNGSLHIVANDSTSGGTPVRPPVLAPAILIDNSSVDHFFNLIGKRSKVTMDNLYLLAVRADEAPLGFCQAIRITADSISLRLRGVIFDAWVESGIRTWAHWTKLDVQDCIFKNSMHSSSYYAGQPFMSDNLNIADTVKFINNTFFCNNSYSFCIRGFDKRGIFEHNTMVYGVVNPFLTRQAPNLSLNNNLFYAMHAWGGEQEDVWWGGFLQNPDTASSTIVLVRAKGKYNGIATAGPEVYVDSAHGVFANMVDSTHRWFDVKNNVNCIPTKLMSYYQAYNDTTTQYYDTLAYFVSGGNAIHLKHQLIPAKFMSGLVKATLDSIIPAQGGHATDLNNIEADPGFNTTITNHLDKLIAYVNKLVTGRLDSTWYFNPSGHLYPPAWPLVENFAYTNTALQHYGTDGFAVGDLNWFPTQKAAWLLTDVKNVDQVPSEFTLSQNYPNPFNPTTNIKFTLTKSENVSLVVYNLLGQKVRTIVDQVMEAGTFVANWDGRNDAGHQLASGAYFYRLETKSFAKTMTMLLLK